MRIRGHGQHKPAITSYRAKPARFWIQIQTYAADGGARPNSGGTPFRQPCPACSSLSGGKTPQARFSEESLRPTQPPETHSQKLTADFPHTIAKNSRHTASLDELAEPNYYNNPFTHRQLLFPHPSDLRSELQNSPRRLPIPTSTSKLQVFQSHCIFIVR